MTDRFVGMQAVNVQQVYGAIGEVLNRFVKGHSQQT